MSLKDLNQIGIHSQQSFLKYNKEEVKLSTEFKSLFTKIIQKDSRENVSFSEYTTIVKTPKELTITFPNQWFYIASFFVDYLNSLKDYKFHFDKALKNIDKNSISEIKKTKQIPQKIIDIIENYFETESDIENFSKFLCNYDWWFGSKTIDRTDYFVSPILSLAKVVNASQSYIAHLTYLLSDNPQLLVYLNESEISQDSPKKINELSDEIKIKSNSIREFALKVFQYFFNNDWNTLLNESKVKSTTINEKKYLIYDHYQFINLIGVFDSPQNKTSLTSSKTIRFFEEPIFEENGKYFYFTTQWNVNGEYNLSFKNLKKYIEDRFINYSVVHEENHFKLISVQNKLTEISQDLFNVFTFKSDCETSGLTYSDQLIIRYISSLTTKPFVLLSGLSGSGKSKLAEAFAQWICESEEQYAMIPVGADWTNKEPLLGYPNALKDNEYVKPDNPALDILIRAQSNPQKPYFLILDEMNLSHVERYFADFLSTMESNNVIDLHNFKDESGNNIEIKNIPSSISLPKNLFIVGTVNIDETTYMFSPKVLDRANTIEFRLDKDHIIDFLGEVSEVDLNNLKGKGANMAEDFVEIVKGEKDKDARKYILKDDDERKKMVLKFFEELQKSGAEFGYRTAFEIYKLFYNLEKFGIPDEDEQLDIAIMQKLLPKLHGSRTKLSRTLKPLAKLCVENVGDDFDKKYFNNFGKIDFKNDENIRFKLSLEKIMRMYNNAVENGFASYAEA